jgi:hypothetical protein
MARTNYHQVRKQKELARKQRQQEKQQRRATRPDGTEESAPGSLDQDAAGAAAPVAVDNPIAVDNPTSGSGS